MANRYLIASGNWSNPAIWSATSGGAGGAGVPTASDAVYIDANLAVSLTADATCGEISHTNGTLSLSIYSLTVTGIFAPPGRFYSYGSTTRTINLDSGSLVLDGSAFDATVLGISGTNLTLNAGTSQIVINAGYGDPADFGASTFNTGNHTFNDVVINLGADSQAVEFNITGSPTFRSLIVQSKNSSAHTVNVDNGAVWNVDKLMLIGSSPTNRLTIDPGETGTANIRFSDNGTCYGQNVLMYNVYPDDMPGVGPNIPYYLGSNSTDANGNGWLIQNPPKTLSLVDAFTASPASNERWIAPSYSGASFPNTTTTGLSGGGYRFGNKSGLISSGTYDFTESSIIFEIPPISTTSSNNTLHVMIGWGKSDGSALIGESSQTAYSGYGFDIKPSSGNYPSSTVKYYRSYGSADSTANFSVPASTKYIRLVCSGGYFKTEISDTGSTWIEQATFATTPDDELLLKSSRIYITTDTTGSDSNTIDIGSINPELGPQVPTANFTASPTSGVAQLPVTFTDTSSGIPDTWSWNFGDGGTSTAQNPSHTYTSPGAYTVTLTASNSLGSDSETKADYISVSITTYEISVQSGGESIGGLEEVMEVSLLSFAVVGGGGGSIYIKTSFQALPQKDYEYRVFDEEWNYIGTWQNVTSDFSYEQGINQNATELNVEIARSPDNRIVKLDYLKDTSGNLILDDNSESILLNTETPNSVGEGTDVRENLNVEVYAFYGGYEAIQDEFGDDILDESSEPILAQYGSPNGRRVYSGYIADYELVYGENTGVNVIVVPHGTETSHYVFKDGTSTTVSYLNTDPVQMARDAMDDYIAQGGYITYTTETMPLSGNSVDYEFKLQTTRQSVDKTVDLLPSGYYQFIDPGQNLQYILQRSATAHHIFYYEKHINELRLRRSITQLVNKTYFVGGEISPGVNLYKYSEDSTSIAALRPGLEILSDSRVTLTDSADILMNREIAEFKNPRWRTEVTVSDHDYDIESIKLGQMVGFKNFGTIADTLILQIVHISRKKHSVTLTLDMTLPNDAKRLEELKKQILNELVRSVGDTPA